MAFNFDMIQQHYAQLSVRVNEARTVLGKPLSLTEKILYSHLWEDVVAYKQGEDYAEFSPDRVAMQDATAQMALLQFMMAGKEKVAVPSTVHADHLIQAKTGSEEDLSFALDESPNNSKSDVENQVTSSQSPIVKNTNDQNDNISDISESDSKNTKKWEDMLEQLAPDTDSVTGIIRVKDDDTMGPMRRKYIKDNNLRKEVAELGIGNNIEEQFYYNHKMVFEKYSNKSDHINREQLYKILFNEFEYDNKYTDEEKVTISGVMIDNNISQYINMLNKQHISFIDYFSIAKHIDIVYKKNFNRFIKLAKESTDIAINNQILRLRDDNIRFKEDELLVNEREKQIEIQNQLLSINESIDIYDIRKYQPNCCDIITNFSGLTISRFSTMNYFLPHNIE